MEPRTDTRTQFGCFSARPTPSKVWINDKVGLRPLWGWLEPPSFPDSLPLLDCPASIKAGTSASSKTPTGPAACGTRSESGAPGAGCLKYAAVGEPRSERGKRKDKKRIKKNDEKEQNAESAGKKEKHRRILVPNSVWETRGRRRAGIL